FSAELIAELGELLVHGIATKPGKPAMFGLIDNKPIIGVPGYPVSADLVFSLFAKPVIYRKMGLSMPESPLLDCTISKKLASHMGVDEYVHVNVGKINDRYIAYPLNRGAGITTSLVNSDGVIHIARGNEGLVAGNNCTVRLKHPRRIIDNTLITIGSHDMAIDILADILQKDHGVRLVSTNAGSMGGIMALRRKETHFSGIHLLDYESGEYNTTYLEEYLPDEKWLLINLVKRQQGLIVKKDNPLGITGLHDLVRKDIRFINRQKGAGTRILLDYLLPKNNLSLDQINGYNREEYTHLAVAASVKNDACDVGMGIYASALAMDLDFIPVTEEQYDICILLNYISQQQLDQLRQVITGSEFKERVNACGGYNLDLSGKVVGKN
ncbi:MAG TPA: substrate-binding domain-containing protein, partial [Syntrophomonadaceae bacterium]|nr:substrate-binding domain-containing protein [Syntrophomonadaceae bacterium]